MVDLCQWWAEEARYEHYAPEGAEGNGYSQLKIFHNFKILVVSLREVVCASRRLLLHSSHHPRKACITSPTATSLAIAVLVVNTDQTTAEGEYFAESDEH